MFYRVILGCAWEAGKHCQCHSADFVICFLLWLINIYFDLFCFCNTKTDASLRRAHVHICTFMCHVGHSIQLNCHIKSKQDSLESCRVIPAVHSVNQHDWLVYSTLIISKYAKHSLLLILPQILSLWFRRYFPFCKKVVKF